jgi:serine/threonine protein kinase
MQLEDALPTKSEFLEELQKEVVFMTDDPEKKYEMIKEIGTGGFARIYLASNISTGEFLALKYMKAGKKKELQSIINEIGIMKLCGKTCRNII